MIGDEVNTMYSSPGLRFKASSPNNQANTYLFDYQFVRKAGKVGEKRALIEKNGKKADPKEPPPNTQAFQYSDILLAPVQLLDERFQEYYTYRLLREDVLNGEKAWVLEVAPRITSGTRYLGGTLWLKQTDSSVLRIEWDPATFGYYEKILLRAKTYRAKPQVVSYTEFGFEKNGLRFPSVDFTEEAYLADNNKVFIRAQTKVAYKNYKFFTVESETAIRK